MATDKIAANTKFPILSKALADRLVEILSSVDDDELAQVPQKLAHIKTAVELMRLELAKAPDSDSANALTTEFFVALSTALSRYLKFIL